MRELGQLYDYTLLHFLHHLAEIVEDHADRIHDLRLETS